MTQIKLSDMGKWQFCSLFRPGPRLENFPISSFGAPSCRRDNALSVSSRIKELPFQKSGENSVAGGKNSAPIWDVEMIFSVSNPKQTPMD